MKSFGTLLTGILLIAITVAVGAAHGTLIGRWGLKPDVMQGAKLLEKVPDQFGDWKRDGDDTTQLDPEAAKVLQCKGHIVRVYDNVRTGDRVSVAVLLGPAGPISVHTPEVCYSARDYQITSDRKSWSLPESDSKNSDTFWDLRLTANNVSETRLRVMYGWTNHQTWQAPDHPRFSYGGSPYLYKLQLAGPVNDDENQRDACNDFLTAFLPVLRNYLIDR
ncbi:exosortase-associated EpsI family protein [Anatilimnocola sp. NA78]|uniref:exosortase-associated EpsI family protein n=1 Tax=Anatilimnocola sp. NA78 TaxID=3415683 RepID=UPI003CE576AF